MTLYGGIEAGGTKFICIVASGPNDIRAEMRVEVTGPDRTLGEVISFFREQLRLSGEPIKALGLACFGPLDLDEASPRYGWITSTPKPGWKDVPIVSILERELKLPVAFDTDVNGAAVGEGVWGAAQGLRDFLYLTIGTGIGGGGVCNGKTIRGLVHPEMGHILIPHHRESDSFEGVCPFHGDCFEGLASGPAIEKRWRQKAESLHADHPAWDLEATYIAYALHNYICILSPKRIILGGGVMEQAHLFPLIRAKVQDLLQGYIRSPQLEQNINDYIVPPRLGKLAGALGAVALARQKYE